MHDQWLRLDTNAPMQDLGPPLPLARSLEPRVPAHQIRQQRVKLILGPQFEFESVHEGDKVLQTRSRSAPPKKEKGEDEPVWSPRPISLLLHLPPSCALLLQGHLLRYDELLPCNPSGGARPHTAVSSLNHSELQRDSLTRYSVIKASTLGTESPTSFMMVLN